MPGGSLRTIRAQALPSWPAQLRPGKRIKHSETTVMSSIADYCLVRVLLGTIKVARVRLYRPILESLGPKLGPGFIPSCRVSKASKADQGFNCTLTPHRRRG